MRDLAREAADVLFDIDNRFFRSIGTLIRRPGALTAAWAAGRRASFTGPMRLYLLSSVLYFLVASLVEPSSVGFITFDNGPELNRAFAEALPRMMFLIVPLAAVVFALAFRAARRLYVEHLVFTLHVHAAWYLIFTAEALTMPGAWDGVRATIATALQVALRLSTVVYLYLAALGFYGGSRRSTALRVFAGMAGYSILLALAVAAYIGVWAWIQR